MKKNELKNGMVVETSDKKRYIVIGNCMCNYHGFMLLEQYDEDLCYSGDDFYNIDKVWSVVNSYQPSHADCPRDLNSVFHGSSSMEDDICLKSIWRRKTEHVIDWSKIPKGTEILVYDFVEQEHKLRTFIALDKGNPSGEIITKCGDFKGCECWKAATIEKPKRRWLKNIL